MVTDGQAAIGAYLAHTRALHVMRFGLEGDIQIFNAAMVTPLGLLETPRGESLYDYLTEPDALVVQAIVRSWLAG